MHTVLEYSCVALSTSAWSVALISLARDKCIRCFLHGFINIS